MKNNKLNLWFWRWHFIAGIVSIPFVLVLSVTGAIYLFKDDVEAPKIAKIQSVEIAENQKVLSLDEQYNIAKSKMKKPISSMVVPQANQNTEFVAGRFSHKTSIFINPTNGEVSGNFSPKDTWMHTVRKLHGELLGGKVGTKFIELVACWCIVLIITGLYVWFPYQRGIKGVFTIRTKEGKRTMFRDIHAVGGFWISIVLILTLAGGLPWTDVFGSNYRALQDATNTGYPKTWKGIGLKSDPQGAPLSVDAMTDIAKAQKLQGLLTLGLPKTPTSTFSVTNKPQDLNDTKMLHFDQYSGKLIKSHNWSDVGIMMRGRMWVMAFHQGQLGVWNWWLMFTFSVLLFLISLSAVASYLLRKPTSSLGVPKMPTNFNVQKGLVGIIVVLGIVFPLFGLSVLLIWVFNLISKKRQKSIA